MLVLTFYMTYIERGCFMISLEKDKAGIDPDNVWRLTSKLKRFTASHFFICHLANDNKAQITWMAAETIWSHCDDARDHEFRVQ